MTDWSRIDSCFQRAAQGGRLLIGAIGGSITQGADATAPEKRYANRVWEWWHDTFPDAQIDFVNAGIGATTSYYGAARVREDLLACRPDFVMIDYAVNDDDTDVSAAAFEGLLRRILRFETRPAVFVLSNVLYNSGSNVQEIQHRIADYYGVPHWSAKDTLYRDILSGRAAPEDFCTPDYWIHPNDCGHARIAQGITGMLKARLSGLCSKTMADPEGGMLPAPLLSDQYDFLKQYTIVNSSPRLQGFYPDPEEKKGHLDFFHGGWLAWEEGDVLEGEVTCSCMAVRFRETINQPCPVARFTVTDVKTGEKAAELILDPNFNETWGDRPALRPLLHHAPRKLYRYRAQIIQAHKNDKTAFHLLSVIANS